MKHKRIALLSVLTLCIITCNFCNAQQAYTKAAIDAFIITRMAAKFHVQPRAVNDSFSIDLYNSLLTEADPDKMIFIKEDIDKLALWQTKLDDEILQKKSTFISLFGSLYKNRLLQADSIAGVISKTPLNYNLTEIFTYAEQNEYAANINALQVKIYKNIKMNALSSMAETIDGIKFANDHLQKREADSLEIIYRKKACKSVKRITSSYLQNAAGFQEQVSAMYCSNIATCYDPHTEYFPLTAKEDFETALGNNAFRFGFSLDDNEDGGVEIEGLKPGSPAFKCGQINKGDKIVSIQWQGKEAVDVSDADRPQVFNILQQSNHDKAVINFKKADGSIRQVELQKEQVSDDEDENRVKSFLLKGDKIIGYILLPAFYTDWDQDESNENGCANDVAKEILKLEKENIQGLIIDLRYNGGGSVTEAENLAGIFIDAGPVAQETGNDGKIFTLKDVNRGTIYNGPLVLLVNAYSASASELVAGTLQDYNRAVIIGTPTYGKATGQVVLPLDTTFSFENKQPSANTGAYLKVTLFKLCRITGKTAQGVGVQPDIFVPDLLDVYAEREKDAPDFLQVADVAANKYYKPYPTINMTPLKQAAARQVADNKYLQSLIDYINETKATGEVDKNIPLTLNDILKLIEKKTKSGIPKQEELTDNSFSIAENAFEQQRIAGGAEEPGTNDEIKKYLTTDAQLQVAYNNLLMMIK